MNNFCGIDFQSVLYTTLGIYHLHEHPLHTVRRKVIRFDFLRVKIYNICNDFINKQLIMKVIICHVYETYQGTLISIKAPCHHHFNPPT